MVPRRPLALHAGRPRLRLLRHEHVVRRAARLAQAGARADEGRLRRRAARVSARGGRRALRRRRGGRWRWRWRWRPASPLHGLRWHADGTAPLLELLAHCRHQRGRAGRGAASRGGAPAHSRALAAGGGRVRHRSGEARRGDRGAHVAAPPPLARVGAPQRPPAGTGAAAAGRLPRGGVLHAGVQGGRRRRLDCPHGLRGLRVRLLRPRLRHRLLRVQGLRVRPVPAVPI
mmetsp:Transcript_43988/g.142785  ORF Transcript_43988/g.142785 Transcript_43988/m.142785 type:complete len:230 (+) Transcript_43988:3770-4459(+)